jgi:hypothetical protein
MPEKMYVLERVNWRRARDACVRLPGFTRIRTYDRKDEAAAEMQRLENASRAKINPFTCGGAMLHYQTSHSLESLVTLLQSHGTDPPTDTSRRSAPWAKWWNGVEATLSAEMREGIWAALDKVRFYRISERDPCPVVFVVVEIAWTYNDNWWDANTEGGTIIRAFSSRDAAEEFRDQANDERWNEIRRTWLSKLDYEGRKLNTQERWHAQLTPLDLFDEREYDKYFVDPKTTSYFEVIEVESPT